jgi:hypothetical protein
MALIGSASMIHVVMGYHLLSSCDGLLVLRIQHFKQRA